MKVGLHGLNVRAHATPDALARSARLAEEAGIESLWMADHVALPDPRTPAATFDPDDAILDSILAMTWAAAATTTVRVATGVLVLPLRNPAVLAKQLATVDVLSGGRLVVGIGVGDLPEESAACGADFHRRGAVADDHLAALRRLWRDPEPRHTGPFTTIDGINAFPRPVQHDVPVVVAGHSPAAVRRVARAGDGWFGWGVPPERARDYVAAIAAAERPAGMGPVEITVAPPPELWTPRAVAAYRDAGVHRLVREMPAAPADLPRVLDEIHATLGTPQRV